MSDVVIRVEGVSKLYRLGEVGTGSLAHDVNRWWHKVRGKEDPYLKIGEVNDRTKPAARAVASNESRVTGEENAVPVAGSELIVASEEGRVAGKELRVTGENQSASEPATRHQLPATAPQGGAPATSYSPLFTPKAPPSDWVYALKDVSFEVKRGEVLGIIGRNGAGKSTLLKILSRVTTQSEGRIKVRGRIASLLEVGTGFHPELTGRENIFLNGAILGMRKAEIARKFDEIVEFSGCARYIDTPVKRYSSGMYVRLAFAVAAHLEPEILIVDEVLAVGDAEFQKKCLGKMKDVAGHGRTILFVSHNMAAVKALCTRSIYLANGLLEMEGPTNEVVSAYLKAGMDGASEKVWNDTESAPGNENILLKSVSVKPPEGQDVITIDTGAVIEVGFQNHKPGINLDFTAYVRNSEDLVLFESGFILSSNRDSRQGTYSVRGEIPGHLLNAGHYSLSVLFGQDQSHALYRFDNVVSFAVENTATGRGHNMNVAPGLFRPQIVWKSLD
jgi:lipopolysaccharide transport system ATP-binding protein